MATFGTTNKIEERKFDNTLYQGIGLFKVIAINPSRAEIAKLYGTTEDRVKEPTYITDTDGFNSKGEQIKTQKLTLEVYIQTKIGEKDLIKRIKYNIIKGCNYSKKGKFEVIDMYGNTAWATPEIINKQEKIMYDKKDGSGKIEANIATPYRIAYRGEKEFILFVRNLLGIKKPFVLDKDGNSTWLPESELKNAVVSFDTKDWDAFFKGNFKELSKIVTLGNINEIQCILGICEINGEKSIKVCTTTLRKDERLSQKMENELIKDTFALYWSAIPKDNIKGTVNEMNVFVDDNGIEKVKKVIALHEWNEVKPDDIQNTQDQEPQSSAQTQSTEDQLPF